MVEEVVEGKVAELETPTIALFAYLSTDAYSRSSTMATASVYAPIGFDFSNHIRFVGLLVCL